MLRERETLVHLGDGRPSSRDVLLGHICRVGNVSRQTAFEDIRNLEAQGLVKFRFGFISVTVAGMKRLRELKG